MDQRPTVCVDLDGVLNTFDIWRGPEHFHALRPGAREFLERLKGAGYRVVVLTCRWHEWASEWLAEHDLAAFVDEVTDRKPPAHAYVDDRAVRFEGDFDRTLDDIVRLRPFWDKAAPR
jgi:haloacid dehalogenase-like hydrolase